MVAVYENNTDKCVFSCDVGEADIETTVNNLAMCYRPPTYDVVVDNYEQVIDNEDKESYEGS